MSDRDQGFATTLVPVDKIKPPLFQCRIQSLDENLDELVESIKTVGLLEPLVIRIDSEKQPELVIGSRRLKACEKAGLTMIPVVIRDLTDEEALEIEGSENLNRNDLSPEEKTRLVSEWAKRGYDANGIVGKVHKSYSWVVSFLPSEFKDQKRAEAGKLGGEAKSATIIVAKSQEQAVKTSDTISDLVECDNCHMATHIIKMKALDDKDLCPLCFERLSKLPKLVREQVIEKHSEPVKESWTQRKAVMTPGISKMDEQVYLTLQNNKVLRDAGWKFEFQKRYYIKEVVSDVTATKGDVEKPLFFDGDVHIGREDRDDVNRGLLARGLKSAEVLTFAYSGEYSDAKRDMMASKIEKSLLEVVAVVKTEA